MRETKYEKFCLLGFVMVMYIILSFTKVKASNNIVIAGIDMGYSDGSYFSKDGSACRCHGRGTCGEASDCNCMVVSGTSQCYGWSIWVENKLFGYNEISNSKNFTTVINGYSNCIGSEIYNKFNGTVGVGAHIRTSSSKKGYAHSVSVISYDRNGINITDCNHSGKCQVDVRYYTWDSFASFMNGYGGISFVKTCKNGISVPSEPSGNNPFGHLDSVTAEMGKITVRGWAADMDVPNEPIDVHIYAIHDGVREGIGVLKADNYRPDIKTTNINAYHGFEATINTTLTGDIQIEAYGINVGAGENSMLEDSPKNIFVPKDIIPPTITNVEVTDLCASGYTVTCNVDDNVGISKVRFVTWTEQNDQDDVVWSDEVVSGNTVSCKINIADHNNENNCVYYTHIYAYDLAENGSGYPVTVYVDAEPPIISDVEITDVSILGYTLTCKVDDNKGISKVRFATWTEEHDQDDIIWNDQEISGNTVSCRVSVADHNNEVNCKYWTHIYAYDLSDNGTGYPVSVYIDGTAPTISNVEVTDISEEGYTVKCTVEDDYSGVNRVQFPTWFNEDVPYTDKEDWTTDSEITGILENGKYVYYVKTSDHKNRFGLYNTHIYAWDEHGNKSEGYPLEITVKKDHEHDYISSVKKKPTCIEDGSMFYICKEGDDSYEEKIPATGHQNTELRNVKEATCVSEGYTGDTYCKDCGTKLSTGQVITKKVHVWDAGKITQEATCIEAGVKTYTCTNCNTARTEEIPATGNHKNTELRNAKEATCTSEGYTGDTYCKDCGMKLSTGQVITKKVHIWDAGKITQEATCVEAGVKTYTCTNCNTARTEEISATGHVTKVTKFAKKATCKTEGYSGDVYCQVCGTLLEEGKVLPKTEHNWNEGETTTSATCTIAGVKTYTCTLCGSAKTEEIPATGHVTKVTKFTKEATCKTEGYSGDVYCQVCGTLLEEGKVLPKVEHSWNTGEITTAATCTMEGTKTFTCTVCKETKIEKIPAKGHGATEVRNRKDATCRAEGYTGDTYCTVCGEVISKGETVAKAGHGATEVRNRKDATCGAEGYTGDTYCTVCGEVISKGETVAKVSHGATEVRNRKDATCRAEGYTGDTYCTVCGEVVSKGETIAKTAHAWDAGKITKQPTTTETGTKTFICQSCGLTRTETMAKLEVKQLTPGKTVKSKATNGVYKVLKDGRSVEFTKPIVKRASVKIPATIKINGITCKVTGISAGAFKNNTSLRTVTIGKNVTSIGTNAFYGCKKLTRIIGGSAVTKIGDKAFYSCSTLTSITIPAGVNKIGKMAFYNCKKLRTIVVKTSKLTSRNIGTKAFTGTYAKANIKVPTKQLNTYKKLFKSKGMGTKAVYKK